MPRGAGSFLWLSAAAPLSAFKERAGGPVSALVAISHETGIHLEIIDAVGHQFAFRQVGEIMVVAFDRLGAHAEEPGNRPRTPGDLGL